MFWIIIIIFLLLWLVGLLGNIGGSLIHLLLIAALVVFLIDLLAGRRGD
ncbi:MAG: lmo0937 family membrane protein [Actinomycetota bacterium]|nr:lmo0937 family membrane protein [Actinomycetota bacterium]